MARLKKRAPRLEFGAVHWGSLLDVPQKAMLKEMKQRGSRGNLVQGISYKTLGDALAYRNVEGAVRLLADYQNDNWRPYGGCTHIIAHSLGCVLALGWLNANPIGPPVDLITLGCNLGLWQAGLDGRISTPRRVRYWYNLFDATDGLGGPIGAFANAVDREVELKGPWYTKFVPAADHCSYWNDQKLFEQTIPNLLGF